VVVFSDTNPTHTKMKTSKNKFRTLFATLTASILIALSVQAANLSEKDKQFLAGYEEVHRALAADDLPSAKSAAKQLGEQGTHIMKAGSLEDARASFEKLTDRAKTLADGQSGYHVFHCPMLKKDWVQTSTTAANPYAGKEMAGCGELKK
jgi:hypothetical protein